MSVFGLGAFFHDGTFTSTVTLETEGIGGISENAPSPELGIISGTPSLRTTIVYDDSRFAYQIMAGLSGSSLPARGVPPWLSFSLKSGRADRCRPN